MIVLHCFLYAVPTGKFKEDSTAFLFSLVNPSRSEPRKMNAIAGVGAGVRCVARLGPCFGIRDWNNLQMCRNAFHFVCEMFYNENLGFQCPEEYAFNTYFTGRREFAISELEVFKVNF